MINFFSNERRMGQVAVVVFVAFALFHVLTLGISPTVWTDEVCFNSVTLDWLHNRTFHFTADMSWANGREALFYGPVFFVLNALFVGTLGNEPFTARVLTLLAGLAVCWLCLRLLRSETGAGKYVAALGAALLLSDIFFGVSLHRARMDTLALLCYLGCAALLLRFLRDPRFARQTGWWVTAGLLCGLSLLTTSRMILFVPALGLLVIWFIAQQRFSVRAFANAFALAAVTAVLVLGWYVYAFRTVATFMDYYSTLRSNMEYNAVTRFTVRRELYAVCAVAATALALSVAALRRACVTPLVVFCIVNIIVYYALVDDTGPYSVLVLPYFYLIVLATFHMLSTSTGVSRTLLRAAVGVLAVYNFSLFGFRSALLVMDMAARRYENVDAFIRRNVPRGARVAGDFVYYYALVNNGNPYQMLFSYQLSADLNKVQVYDRDTFNYDYLVIADRTVRGHPLVSNIFLKGDSLVLVASFTTEHPALLWKLDALGVYELRRGTYDGTVYRRVRGGARR